MLSSGGIGALGQGSGNGEKLLQLAQSMAAKQLEGGSEQGDPVNALLLYHSILQVIIALDSAFVSTMSHVGTTKFGCK